MGGRHSLEIDCARLLRLWNDGKTLSQLCKTFRASRSTIERRLVDLGAPLRRRRRERRYTKRKKKHGRLPLCIGAVPDARTRLAIDRFKLKEKRLTYDEWQDLFNDLYKKIAALGCPECGKVRKHDPTADSLCRVHFRMRAAVARSEHEAIDAIPRLIRMAKRTTNRIAKIKRAEGRELRALVKSISQSGKSKSARLLALLKGTE